MSKIIRYVNQSWTPMPGTSLDPRVHIPPDIYRFTQNQIESEQRQHQRNVNRTITAGRQAPPAAAPTRTISFDQGVIPVMPLTPE